VNYCSFSLFPIKLFHNPSLSGWQETKSVAPVLERDWMAEVKVFRFLAGITRSIAAGEIEEAVGGAD